MSTSPRRYNIDRAVASYEALRQHFGRTRRKLFRETTHSTDSNPYSYAWPYSRALAATVDMARLPGIGSRYLGDLRDRLEGLERYWNGRGKPPAYDSSVRSWLRPAGDQYYDDNAWIGLELVHVYRLTSEPSALRRAAQVFAFLVSGWDDDPHHPAPGGVFWVRADWCRDRNTVSTAPAAELGAWLYREAGEDAYLAWARQMYDWVEHTLRAPNGLYWDHIDSAGNIEKTQWSYNQGTMAGAAVLLYRATGERAFRARAEEIAAAALDLYGADERYLTQSVAFNAIFFKNLLLLEAENGETAYRQAMQAYADRIWDTTRDPRTGLFHFDPAGPVELLQQSAMVEIYASLAGGDGA